MKRRALVMVAALTLAGGACGGDDDGDVTDGASATSDDSNEADDGEDSGDDVGSGGGEWCDLARELESETVFDTIDVEDPDSVESAYREIVDILNDAAETAPDEIKADVETVAASTEKLFEALEDVEFDFAALDASVLGDVETVAASDRIEEYGERVCGIGSDDGSDGTIGGASDDGDVGDVGDDGTIGGLDDSAIRDQIVSQFEALGITEDQANCLLDNMDSEDVAAAGDQVDPSMFLHLFSTCGIDFDPQAGG